MNQELKQAITEYLADTKATLNQLEKSAAQRDQTIVELQVKLDKAQAAPVLTQDRLVKTATLLIGAGLIPDKETFVQTVQANPEVLLDSLDKVAGVVANYNMRREPPKMGRPLATGTSYKGNRPVSNQRSNADAALLSRLGISV